MDKKFSEKLYTRAETSLSDGKNHLFVLNVYILCFIFVHLSPIFSKKKCYRANLGKRRLIGSPILNRKW